jgi:hypothetical protein
MRLTIDAYIFSWTGYHTKAATIAKALLEKVNRVTVVYSDREDDVSTGQGRWIRVPNEHFGGKKFERCLAEFNGDIMLLITADAQRDNWASLVDSCEQAFTRNGAIGVWSPSVKYSPWHLNRTSLSIIEGTSLHLVTRTDSIVWALSKDTVGRLSQLDYSRNNIGWGIDTIACAYCHAKRRLVTVDDKVTVFHPLAKGYDHLDAFRQQAAFLNQMTAEEERQYNIAQDYMNKRRADAGPFAGNSFLQSVITRNEPCPCGSGKRFKMCHGALV